MKSKKKTARVTEVLIHGGNDLEHLPAWPGEVRNGTRYEHQLIKNPHVPGEREKMLEKRNKLTLKAFQIAYENHHRRRTR